MYIKRTARWNMNFVSSCYSSASWETAAYPICSFETPSSAYS